MGMQSVNIKKQVLTTRTSAQSNDIGIWKDGCIEILEVMLKRDLIEYPFAWVYIWVGLILALVELITVFLACSYVAQINRSSQKNLAWFFSMIICSPSFFVKCCRRQRHQRMYTRADDDGNKFLPGGKDLKDDREILKQNTEEKIARVQREPGCCLTWSISLYQARWHHLIKLKIWPTSDKSPDGSKPKIFIF